MPMTEREKQLDKIRQKRYRAKHLPEINKRKRDKYYATVEDIKRKKKEYREKHPEVAKAEHERYRVEHKDKIDAYYHPSTIFGKRANHKKRWTPEEVAVLLDTSLTIPEVAKKLERSVGSVICARTRHLTKLQRDTSTAQRKKNARTDAERRV